MLSETLNTIEKHGLLASGDRVLVGVSGGGDSTGLLYLLFALSRTLGIRLDVVHIHHGLRGVDADHDAEFVQNLGWKLGVPVHVVKVDTRERATRDQISIEMAARALRHEAFQSMLKGGLFNSIALAHTLDDQAETIMMRLVRGTSLRGLGGMDFDVSVKGMRIIRPLLGTHRHTLRAYLDSHRIEWMEDQTNTSMAFLRNRMRHEILPLLKTHFNSSASVHLVNMAQEARQVADYLDQQVDEVWGACTQGGVSKKDPLKLIEAPFLNLDPILQNRLTLRWLRLCGVPEWGLSRNTLEALQHFLTSSTRAWNFPGNVLIERCRGGVRLGATATETGHRLNLALPGAVELRELGIVISVEACRGRYPVYPNRIGTYPQEAYLSQRLVKQSLLVRSWEPGDRISPLGMKGRKKIQDVFTDEKVERSDRKRIPLICLGEQVLWIPGYAVDRRAGVEDFSEPSWHITLHPASEYENAHKSQ